MRTNRSSKWLPVIDPDLCSGCGKCVEACGPECFEIVEGVAVLSDPETCGSEEHCIEPCASSALTMAWVAMEGDQTVGKWLDVPGVD